MLIILGMVYESSVIICSIIHAKMISFAQVFVTTDWINEPLPACCRRFSIPGWAAVVAVWSPFCLDDSTKSQFVTSCPLRWWGHCKCPTRAPLPCVWSMVSSLMVASSSLPTSAELSNSVFSAIQLSEASKKNSYRSTSIKHGLNVFW